MSEVAEFGKFLARLGIDIQSINVLDAYNRATLDVTNTGVSVSEYFEMMLTARDDEDLREYLKKYIVNECAFEESLALCLKAIPVPKQKYELVCAFRRGSKAVIEWFTSNTFSDFDLVSVVKANVCVLKGIGAYENVLGHAYISREFDDGSNSLQILRELFGHADKSILKPLGDSPPTIFPTTVYRGVCSGEQASGAISWTLCLNCACHFAAQKSDSPQIYSMTIEESDYLIYSDSMRPEKEFIILQQNAVTILPLSKEEIIARAVKWEASHP